MIKITEAEALIVEESKSMTESIMKIEYLITNTTLSLTTIARLVEGEAYEIEYPTVFEVGDLVRSETDMLFIVREDTSEWSSSTLRVSDVNADSKRFTLVVKGVVV